LWIAALGALLLAGCAKDVSEPTPRSAIQHQDTPPVVLENPTVENAIAYHESDRQLTSADWEKLEQIGPRPMWERLRAQHESSRDHQIATTKTSSKPATKPTTNPADIDMTKLPATISDTPDGRVRIIWKLQNFGGSSVYATADGDTSRRHVTASPPDLSPLVLSVTQQAGVGATVVPLPQENTLVITCIPANRNSVLAMLAAVDVPPRQVEITAKIFEVSHDFDFQIGARTILKRIADSSSQSVISQFDTSRFLDSLGSGSPFQGSVFSLVKTFQDAGISVDASLQLLAEAGLINVVSSPRMTVAAGQTGYMLAGQELPIQSSSIANSTTQISTTYKPVGVQLYITPQVISDDRIKLHTISIVSSVSGFAPLPTLAGGTQAGTATLVNPILDSREAETAVTIADKSTLVISGLRMVRTTTRENKVPGLGDIPALGWLFKTHRSQQQVTDLYFFVTPQLL
jgi:type II secretory pathway component GspD/PulD (secretin)